MVSKKCSVSLLFNFSLEKAIRRTKKINNTEKTKCMFISRHQNARKIICTDC
jgi:hypothetical protein